MINYIFLFLTRDYPYAYMANNTKFSLLAKGLSSLGCKVCIINDPYHSNKGSYKLCSTDGYDIIQWSSQRDVIFSNVRLVLRERFVKGAKNVVIVEYFNFIKLNNIILLCKNEGYLVGAAFQEWHWNIEKNLRGKINAFVIERLLYKKCNFIMPISEFLITKAKQMNRNIFKLPIISTFHHINQTYEPEPYFAYCASLAYKDSIFKAIDALSLAKYDDIRLKLIVNGSPCAINEFINEAKTLPVSNKIDIYYNVSSDVLKKIYSRALGLLIPLIPNYIPDIARFSQKIAEYLEMARPILTTNVGEIPFYFTDRKNVYIMEYTAESIAMVMDEIYEKPIVSNQIGKNGWELGNNYFNVYRVSADLNRFVESL